MNKPERKHYIEAYILPEAAFETADCTLSFPVPYALLEVASREDRVVLHVVIPRLEKEDEEDAEWEDLSFRLLKTGQEMEQVPQRYHGHAWCRGENWHLFQRLPDPPVPEMLPDEGGVLAGMFAAMMEGVDAQGDPAGDIPGGDQEPSPGPTRGKATLQ